MSFSDPGFFASGRQRQIARSGGLVLFSAHAAPRASCPAFASLRACRAPVPSSAIVSWRVSPAAMQNFEPSRVMLGPSAGVSEARIFSSAPMAPFLQVVQDFALACLMRGGDVLSARQDWSPSHAVSEFPTRPFDPVAKRLTRHRNPAPRAAICALCRQSWPYIFSRGPAVRFRSAAGPQPSFATIRTAASQSFYHYGRPRGAGC